MATMAQSRDGSPRDPLVNLGITKAAPPIFPFPSHRSLDQVDWQEKQRERALVGLERMDDWGFERREIGRTMARANKQFLAALNAEVRV